MPNTIFQTAASSLNTIISQCEELCFTAELSQTLQSAINSIAEEHSSAATALDKLDDMAGLYSFLADSTDALRSLAYNPYMQEFVPVASVAAVSNACNCIVYAVETSEAEDMENAYVEKFCYKNANTNSEASVYVISTETAEGYVESYYYVGQVSEADAILIGQALSALAVEFEDEPQICATFAEVQNCCAHAA